MKILMLASILALALPACTTMDVQDALVKAAVNRAVIVAENDGVSREQFKRAASVSGTIKVSEFHTLPVVGGYLQDSANLFNTNGKHTRKFLPAMLRMDHEISDLAQWVKLEF
jgi:hypothetical protein